MIDLTTWQQNFIRRAIHQAKINKPVMGYIAIDEMELINFSEEMDKCYPDLGAYDE